MIAGGAEFATTPTSVGGFCAMKALSTRNDEPEKASRPWDRDRDGFVMGDGAGILVLEEYERARARGARIYCEVAGFGMSGDAFHMTAPSESGEGAARCMRNAIKDAGIDASAIGYINAHGTSTPAGDLAETMAIKAALGAHAYKTMISSTKSMTGHLLGAAGGVEAVFSAMALHTGIIPPTINLDHPSQGCDLDYVSAHRAPAAGRYCDVEFIRLRWDQRHAGIAPPLTRTGACSSPGKFPPTSTCWHCIDWRRSVIRCCSSPRPRVPRRAAGICCWRPMANRLPWIETT